MRLFVVSEADYKRVMRALELRPPTSTGAEKSAEAWNAAIRVVAASPKEAAAQIEPQ